MAEDRRRRRSGTLAGGVLLLTVVLAGCSTSAGQAGGHGRGHHRGTLRAGQQCALIKPRLARRWLGGAVKASASGAPSSLGGGVVTKIDECLYRARHGQFGYVLTSSALYAAGGLAGNLIQNEVVGKVMDLPGAQEFHVPIGSTSFGYTMPLHGKYAGGADFLEGKYLAVIVVDGLPRKHAKRVALNAARRLGHLAR